MVSVLQKNLKSTFFLLCTLLFITLVLSACNTQPAPDGAAIGFEFRVDPQTEQVTLLGSNGRAVQPNSTPSDSRILVPDVDIGLKDLSFEFRSPDKLIVRFAAKNITDDANFAQPFFFTLSSESKNLVKAFAPLVTDEQLGGDGVLSPGETSQRFYFSVTFKENEPFTFLVNASAVVEGDTGAACTNPVDIPDTELEAAVRFTLAKSGGDITCADMASLTELQAIQGDITDLEGLQYAVNLTTLDLFNNNIRDLELLSGLTNLTRLILFDNPISDLTPLQNLTNLTFLDLDSTQTGDIAPLAGLTNLTTLDLRRNQVDDLAPLAGLTNLTTLFLDSNQIGDLTPLAGLADLAELILTSNQISDLAPLEGLNLTVLDLGDNEISDPTPLAGLTSLATLSLLSNQVSDLTPLAGLTNLTALDLGNNQINDLAPLAGLTNLVELFLDSNQISDISTLVTNEGIGRNDLVFLSNNPLSTQALADVETLRDRGVEVNLDEVEVQCRTLSPLANDAPCSE